LASLSTAKATFWQIIYFHATQKKIIVTWITRCWSTITTGN